MNVTPEMSLDHGLRIAKQFKTGQSKSGLPLLAQTQIHATSAVSYLTPPMSLCISSPNPFNLVRCPYSPGRPNGLLLVKATVSWSRLIDSPFSSLQTQCKVIIANKTQQFHQKAFGPRNFLVIACKPKDFSYYFNQVKNLLLISVKTQAVLY